MVVFRLMDSYHIRLKLNEMELKIPRFPYQVCVFKCTRFYHYSELNTSIERRIKFTKYEAHVIEFIYTCAPTLYFKSLSPLFFDFFRRTSSGTLSSPPSVARSISEPPSENQIYRTSLVKSLCIINGTNIYNH